MAKFDYKGFLKEGGIEKYLIEENFGNDIESRYQFIRPLMSRLPDTAYTESLIDGMEEGRAGDDKTMFDFYFVEAMKALGLESELMEADSLINPEAEEIDPEDLAASADYFDNLSENDDVLDEMLDEDVPLGIVPPFAIGDLVYRKFDDQKAPMKVVKMRKMFASPLHAVTVVGTSGGDELEYDETQLVKLMSPEEKANAFVREEVNEIFGFGKSIKYVDGGPGAFGTAPTMKDGAKLESGLDEFKKTRIAKKIEQIVSDTKDLVKAKGKAKGSSAYGVPGKLKGYVTKYVAAGDKEGPTSSKFGMDIKTKYPSAGNAFHLYLKHDGNPTNIFFNFLEAELKKDPEIAASLWIPDMFPDKNSIDISLKGDRVVSEEVEGEVQTENKLLKASNTLEDALNKVADDLTDEQIDKFTEMILDLRDKVKGLKEEKEATDVKTIDKLLPKINNKKEFIELLPKLINLDIVGLNNQTKKAMLLKIAKQLK